MQQDMERHGYKPQLVMHQHSTKMGTLPPLDHRRTTETPAMRTRNWSETERATEMLRSVAGTTMLHRQQKDGLRRKKQVLCGVVWCGGGSFREGNRRGRVGTALAHTDKHSAHSFRQDSRAVPAVQQQQLVSGTAVVNHTYVRVSGSSAPHTAWCMVVPASTWLGVWVRVSTGALSRDTKKKT